MSPDVELNEAHAHARGLRFWLAARHDHGVLGRITDHSKYHWATDTFASRIEREKKGRRVGYRFKDSLDAIELDYRVMSGLNSLTVMWWQWFAGGVNNYSVFSNANSSTDNAFLVFRASDKKLYLYRDNTTGKLIVVASPDMTSYEGRWAHIAVIQSKSALEAWAVTDGQERTHQALGSSYYPVQVDPGGAFIGQEQDSVGGGFAASQRFVGWLDDFRIYDRAMHIAEIQSIVRATQPGRYGRMFRPRRRTRYVDFGGTAGIVAPQRTLLGVGV